MNKLRLFFILLILTSFFTACASTAGNTKKSETSNKNEAPVWMNNIEAAYPSAKYLAATGSGSSRARAQEDAAAFLAQQFAVNVKVDTVAQKKYEELTGKDENYAITHTAVDHTIGTSANEKFINLKYSDPYSDTAGTTYVVAYLEKEPTAAIYRSMINNDMIKAENYYERAAAIPNAYQRYAYYDAAYTIALNAENMINQLRIIQPGSVPSLEAKLALQKYAKAKDNEAQKLTYKIEITGDSKNRISSIVKESLQTLSISYNQNGNMIVKGNWSLEPVTVNPRFKSVRYILDISLVDETGKTVAHIYKESRENGISDSEAENFAYREAGKYISAELPLSINSSLTEIVVK